MLVYDRVCHLDIVRMRCPLGILFKIIYGLAICFVSRLEAADR
jgi:hypothetical protein